jgi:putative Holliday junction resolvase
MNNKILTSIPEETVAPDLSVPQVNYLGIDWGRSDVGVAMAESETRIAFAYAMLHNRSGVIDEIRRIVRKEAIGTIVIGLPSHVNRDAVDYPSEKFGNALAKRVPSTRIVYQNEMFTTKLAQRNLIDRGVTHVSKHDDEEAARIILQEWLDRQ